MPSFEYEATTASGERVISTAFGRDLSEVIQSLSSQGFNVLRIEDAYTKSDPLRSAPQAAFASAGQVFSPAPEVVTTAGNREIPSSVQAPILDEKGSVREQPNIGKRNVLLTNLIGPLFLGVPLKDLSFFFRQFGTMMEAGVP